MDKREALNTAKKYATLVRKELSPSEIILYGSYSNGNPNKNSDIDIAVIFNGIEGDFLGASTRLWLLAYKVSDDIEPVLIDSANDKSGFLSTVKSTGVGL